MTHQPLAPPAPGTPPENYERFFVPAIGLPVARTLIRAADLRQGERVLDVGCGTGVVTRLAAERTGPGTVAGLDPNPGMLAVARAASSPALGIAWHEAGAESMPLPDGAFDVVLCQLSLQFVPEPAEALREMRRVLAPPGRLALNVPGPAAAPFEILADTLARHLGAEAGGFVRAVFAMHDESSLSTLLAGAGFDEISTSADIHDLPLPAPRDFLRQYVWSTPLAAVVSEADEDARAAVEHDVVAEWTRFAEGDGMRYRQRIVTAVAR